MERQEAIDTLLSFATSVANEYARSTLERNSILREVVQSLGTLGVSMKEIESTSNWQEYKTTSAEIFWED